MSFDMMFRSIFENKLLLAFPGEELSNIIVGLVNLRLPALDALGLPGVSQRVSIVNENFTVVDVLFCHIFLSFSAFYGCISCIHCQMLCDLQMNLSCCYAPVICMPRPLGSGDISGKCRDLTYNVSLQCCGRARI